MMDPSYPVRFDPLLNEFEFSVVEVSPFFFSQKTRDNVECHANATHVDLRVDLLADRRSVSLVIADDGVGFDPSLRKPGHYGLVGIEEQARAVGGSHAIESAPGRGTRLRVLLPVDTAAGRDPSSSTDAERTRTP